MNPRGNPGEAVARAVTGVDGRGGFAMMVSQSSRERAKSERARGAGEDFARSSLITDSNVVERPKQRGAFRGRWERRRPVKQASPSPSEKP